jgi:hypothetical protein
MTKNHIYDETRGPQNVGPCEHKHKRQVDSSASNGSVCCRPLVSGAGASPLLHGEHKHRPRGALHDLHAAAAGLIPYATKPTGNKQTRAGGTIRARRVRSSMRLTLGGVLPSYLVELAQRSLERRHGADAW